MPSPAGAQARKAILKPHEPPPFAIEQAQGRSPFLLVCDHAGRQIPERLGDLGLSVEDRCRHIAWDIGIAGVASQLAQRLDAWLIRQAYSRLVIDCNRPPRAPGSIVSRSEHTEVPANHGLSEAAIVAREQEIFWPYHRRIEAELDRRQAVAMSTVLVSLHSFTPVYLGRSRPWHLGLLYQHDARLAQVLLELMRADGHWQVGDNQPYAVSDTTDYALPVHGERRGLLHVAIELRQDLLAEPDQQAQWAERLADWLLHAHAVLAAKTPG